MNEFKLVYGEYSWPEYSSSITVIPSLIVGGKDVSFAQALRRGILQKKDRSGLYSTEYNGIRFLLTGEINGTKMSPINVFISLKGKDFLHLNLYPSPEIMEFGWESGYFFTADNSRIMRNMKELRSLYMSSVLDSMESVTPESIDDGIRLCKVLSTQISAKTRFS